MPSVMEKELQEARATLKSLQGDLMVAHATNAELETQVKKKAEEVRALTECASLAEVAHEPDPSSPQK